MTTKPFRGVSRLGDADLERVRLIQSELNARGYGKLIVDGIFGSSTAQAVALFQAQSESRGRPLTVDGVVGPITWEALFGVVDVSKHDADLRSISALALNVAVTQIGVMESPVGSNRGPEVDRYLQSVGIDPAISPSPWCAAFVHWCFATVSEAQGRSNPCPRTASALQIWRLAGMHGCRRISQATAIEEPDQVVPGCVFVIDTGGGHGHVGLVESQIGGTFQTIEGNTNAAGGREGVGVFRRWGRSVWSINKGFVDFSVFGGRE